MPYDPPRRSKPLPPKNPLEIDLVYNVRPCGTCGFFWPGDSTQQPYGPYPCYDFDSNTPDEKEPVGNASSFVWIQGTTRAATFPDAEVMDGCRKAPIMTIGINPNLTAFALSTTGASWCYPSFSSDGGTDSWTKYAYYYRYRSVYQEHFDFEFAKTFLLQQDRIKAEKPGVMLSSARANYTPDYAIRVQYDGDPSPTAIHISDKPGVPRHVILFDAGKRFKGGDALAARLDMPPGRKADVYGQPISYYTQMTPVLGNFQKFLNAKGHADAHLRVGEDVGQLDMVACASPHWGKEWLGGTNQSVNNVVSNCVRKNAWAMKQVVQTRPAILFLVGQASWNMFRETFGHLIQGKPALPNLPEDGPYTLLRLTSQNDYRLVFDTKIDGMDYGLSTRLVITPHFSYNVNFLPQFRMGENALNAFASAYPDASKFLNTDPRIEFQKPAGGFAAFGLKANASAVLAEMKTKFPSAANELEAAYYDPHQIMAGVLEAMFDKGELSYTKGAGGQPGFLSRGEGPCTFCVNDHWTFPKGCPYGKPEEKQYPIGFLEKVVAAMLSGVA
jgi:hypothetical protein